MKLFTNKVFTHRKIILIFLLAILLPSLTVGYLSLNTFSKRRETVKKIFESNLLISGEAAINKIEDALIDFERAVLKTQNFRSLIQALSREQLLFRLNVLSENFPIEFFLLNSSFEIIFPRTGGSNKKVSQSEVGNFKINSFEKIFKRGEYYEFSLKKYTRAIEVYKECLKIAPSAQLQARVMEALGRSLLSAKRYNEALSAYQELYNEHKKFLNTASHPYGIISILQIAEINFCLNKKDMALKLLLDLYKEIRSGNWLLNISTYEFFVFEIESILNKFSSEKNFSKFHEALRTVQEQPSPYSRTLQIVEFLKNKIIPFISHRLELAQSRGEAQIERFLAGNRRKTSLISFKTIPDLDNQSIHYGGICWDTRIIKNQFLQDVLRKIADEKGLQLSIIDGRNRQSSGKNDLIQEGDHVFYFHKFPFNWKLKVSHPDLKNLEKEGQKEIILFGLLLSVILILMILGAFLIARDISRESDTTRLKTEFVHNISHEFKTPLTLIRLYGETLQSKKDISEQQKIESYEIITKESERLSHLINNVLDFSRIEMDRKEFNFQKGNLSRVIEGTLESYNYHLKKKGFTITKNITPNITQVEFDKEAITSVLINLLSNVMKFSTKTKEVTINLFRKNKHATLQVIDKGIGISPEDLGKIFERFYRASDRVVSEIGGSGLGLPLIKHIVNAHGGKTEVQSEPGKGSVFSVILPFYDIREEENVCKNTDN